MQQGSVSPHLLASSHGSSAAGRDFTNLSNQAGISCPIYCQEERKERDEEDEKPMMERGRVEKTYWKRWCHYGIGLSVSAGTHTHIHTCKWVSNPQTKCSFTCLHVRIHACWHIHTHNGQGMCRNTIWQACMSIGTWKTAKVNMLYAHFGIILLNNII